jgi:hypothetical protein
MGKSASVGRDKNGGDFDFGPLPRLNTRWLAGSDVRPEDASASSGWAANETARAVAIDYHGVPGIQPQLRKDHSRRPTASGPSTALVRLTREGRPWTAPVDAKLDALSAKCQAFSSVAASTERVIQPNGKIVLAEMRSAEATSLDQRTRPAVART